MQRWQVIALLVSGIVLVAGAVLAFVKFGGRFELKTPELVLLVLPLVLLVMDKLKMPGAFAVKADFSELFADAARTRIAAGVADTQAPGVEEVINLLAIAVNYSAPTRLWRWPSASISHRWMAEVKRKTGRNRQYAQSHRLLRRYLEHA